MGEPPLSVVHYLIKDHHGGIWLFSLFVGRRMWCNWCKTEWH